MLDLVMTYSPCCRATHLLYPNCSGRPYSVRKIVGRDVHGKAPGVGGRIRAKSFPRCEIALLRLQSDSGDHFAGANPALDHDVRFTSCAGAVVPQRLPRRDVRKSAVCRA